jgi:methylenetetrahydrofolate--tRNA-(uracil-5-)-methyltransferase
MSTDEYIKVIGGGLAGVEAAWQAARLGARVRLYEMRPVTMTPAHRTDQLAEIVCSNSLKSDEPGTAPYLLKEELRRGGSLVMEAAAGTRVPAGAALSVDRIRFAAYITDRIESSPNIEIVREEVKSLSTGKQAPASGPTIVATGPLTSDALTAEIMRLTGDDQLYFYDAIAPIVAADSIDMSIAFKAARYGKGGDDYINCPMNPEEYQRFYDELTNAISVPVKRFESTQWFEACLPLEELARRGVDTLRYGPMKPKGLYDPRTGEEPYACVQLRQENLMADAFGMVGFQNHLKYGEQVRVLRLIPGLENAEFLQYGQIHRNTFINSPKILNETLATRANAQLFFAGQITGVEGYVESVATGWLAGINAVRFVRGQEMLTAPATSATGALCRYVSNVETKNFQPVNITFGLLEPLPIEQRKKHRNKRERHMVQVERALEDWDNFLVGTRASVPARVSPQTIKDSPLRHNSRGYLPHYDSPQLLQYVTFRLADSLPNTILKTLDFKLESKQISEIEYFRAIEKALDLGTGPAFLKHPDVARIVAEVILRFAGEKYELQNWVIMPTHAHILIRTIEPHKLSDAMHSIKSFTASAANKILGRSGRFWSPDYFDRFIRDARHYSNVNRYIDENPVKAGLSKSPAEWPWGSAGWRG